MKLKQKALRATIATFIGQGIQFTFQLASITVLARYLGPDSYGKVAIATSLSGILGIFAAGGLSTATLQKPNLNQEESSSMFWLNVFLGFMLCVVLSILGPLLSYTYQDNDYNKIMPCLGLSALISGFSVQKAALLARKLEFGKIAFARASAQVVGIACSIAAAVYGLSYWALIIRPLTEALATNVSFSIASEWRPDWKYKHSAAKPMLKFGFSVMLSEATGALNRGIDTLIIGYFLGTESTGLYNRAKGVLNLPLTKIMAPISKVGRSAIFRTTNEQNRFSNAVFAITSLTTFISALIVLLLISIAEPLILILLGQKWEATIPIFIALTPFAFVEPCARFFSSVIIAKGDSRPLLKWKIFGTVLTSASLLTGIHWGLIGIATCYSLTGLFIRMPLFLCYTSKHSKISSYTLLSYILPSLTAGIVIAIALLWIQTQWTDLKITQTIAISIFSIVLYILLLLPFSKGRVTFKVISWLLRKKNKSSLEEVININTKHTNERLLSEISSTTS